MLKNRIEVKMQLSPGFSLPEVLIVILVLAIVTTVSLMGISKAQPAMHLTNGAETLKVYLEKAFSDAKRRHAQGDLRPKIQVTGSNTYQVTIDFNGDGVPETQTITLPSKTAFVYDTANPPTATIDWRGNVAEGNVLFKVISSQSKVIEVQMSRGGDTNFESEFPTMPTVVATPYTTDVKTSMVLSGEAVPNVHRSPTPTPTPLPVCQGGQKPTAHDCRCKNNKEMKNDGTCS